MVHAVTSETRARVLRPTTFGMNPAIAERLSALGIDPEERSAQIQTLHSQRRAKRMPAAARTALGISPPDFMTLSLDPDDVRVPPLLNQAALMFENNEYIADVLAPVQLTRERSAKYKIWDRASFRSLIDARIGPNGSAKEVAPTLSQDNFSVVPRALKGFTNDDAVLANPTIAARAMTVEGVAELHAVRREYDIATLFNTPTIYPGNNVRALGAATKWNGGASADPVADVLYSLEQIPGIVTDCAMSDLVWHAAQQNAELKAIVASRVLTNQGLLAPMDFGLYFGIPNIWITKCYYIDDTNTRQRIWGGSNLWFGAINPRRDERTFCRTFRLQQGAGGWITKTWRDEDKGENGGEWTRVAYAEDRKIVSGDYGALITGVRQ